MLTERTRPTASESARPAGFPTPEQMNRGHGATAVSGSTRMVTMPEHHGRGLNGLDYRDLRHSGEWRNRQTRRIQVPVSERMWGFKSPLAHPL